MKKQTLEFLRRSDHSLTPVIRRATPAVIRGATDPGCVRDKNEDQFLIADLQRRLQILACGIGKNDGRVVEDDPPGHFILVADGMGGHAGGEVASAIVTDVMIDYAFSMMPWLGPNPDHALVEKIVADGLRLAVRRTQDKLREVAERKNLARNMGSTLTLGYVVWPHLYLVHVGDSRAYLQRAGKLSRLTKDHSLTEMLVAEGMPREEASKANFGSILTNVLNADGEDAEAELVQMTLEEGDLLLFCTDGLYGEISDETIDIALGGIAGANDVEPCVHGLIAQAKAAGGKDNVTVVIARF
jgi:serine/threonine protein phosphatase PrpC